jgi:hypothetical protein
MSIADMQRRVAAVKGLPADLADRLYGQNETEIADDADRLLDALGPAEVDMNALLRSKSGHVAEATTGNTTAVPTGSRIPPPPAVDMNSRLREAAFGRR